MPSPPTRSLAPHPTALFLLFLALAFLTVASGCSTGSEPSTADGSASDQQVTLALNWFPEAEHGGFYAALVHGYFEEEGLNVEIQSGGPGAPVIQQVATGRVEFAVANADQVLLGRDQQAPVVALMTSMQDSPRCIMVHEKGGPRSLLELRDLTLAVGSGKPFARFLLEKLGPDAQLTIVPYQGNVAMFLERQDFAQQAYVFSEPFIARQQGGDPRCLMVSELGFNPYSSLLIANDALVAERPEIAEKMVRASVRGWRKYLEDPEPTNRYIHKLNPEMSLEILAYGAEQLRGLCLPAAMPADQLGTMTDQRWRELAEQLAEIELLEDPSVWRQAYDSRFLSVER